MCWLAVSGVDTISRFLMGPVISDPYAARTTTPTSNDRTAYSLGVKRWRERENGEDDAHYNHISIRQFPPLHLRFEPVRVQTHPSGPSIEGIHNRVVGSFAATTEVDGDFDGAGPRIALSLRNLGLISIVTGNRIGLPFACLALMPIKSGELFSGPTSLANLLISKFISRLTIYAIAVYSSEKSGVYR
jgi:hypothetical protein